MNNRIETIEKKIKEQQEEINRLKKKYKASGFFLFYLLSKADGSII